MAQSFVAGWAAIEATESLADRVKRLRQARGWTQEDLARQVGVTRNQVWLVESGQSRRLQKRVAELYAQAFEVSTEYLVTGQELVQPEGLPPFDSYLRQTTVLDEEQIQFMRRAYTAFEAERTLRELQSAYGAQQAGEGEGEDLPAPKLADAAYDQPEVAEQERRAVEDWHRGEQP